MVAKQILDIRSVVTRLKGDRQIRSTARDGGLLLSGDVLSSCLGFITVALIARSLGPDGLGSLVLCQTAIHLIAALLLPKPWQTVVRYGADYRARGEAGRLWTLLLFGYVIEAVAAVLAFLVISVALGAQLWDLDGVPLIAARIYTVTLVVNLPGTPTSVFRLFRRYKLQAGLSGFEAILKLALVGLALHLKPDMTGFVLAYTLSEVLARCGAIGASLLVLRSEHILGAARVSLRTLLRECNGLVRFGLSMHLTDLVGTAMREVDYVLVGVVLAPSAVGMLKILKQFGRPLSLLANPIKQVTYPEACEINASRSARAMTRYLVKIYLLLGAILAASLILVFLSMSHIIRIAFGAEFITISRLASLYMLIHSVFLVAQALHISALASGKGEAVFLSYVIMNVVYICFVLALAPSLQLGGVVLAFGAGVIAWTSWLLVINRRSIRRGSSLVHASDHLA